MQTIISVIYTICGILYTALAGKGRVICYTFGITATCCYSYLAYDNQIYGNFLLNIGYYLPMQIIGIFAWNKNLKKDKKEIIKTKLSKKERLILAGITTKLCIIMVAFLKSSNDMTPVLDGITTILSVLGMYLTVKRCIEQWLIWIIVNSLAIIMWLKVSFSNHETYSTAIVWFVYLVMGIYFYRNWRKELSDINPRQTNLEPAS